MHVLGFRPHVRVGDAEDVPVRQQKPRQPSRVALVHPSIVSSDHRHDRAHGGSNVRQRARAERHERASPSRVSARRASKEQDVWFWLLTTGVCVWWAIEEPDTGNRTFLTLLGCVTATLGAVRAYQLWREEREARRGP